MRIQSFSILILVFCFIAACSPRSDTRIIGAKIYEHDGPYDLLFERWNELGINTGFCSQELISDQDFMNEARDHEISTFLIFPVFFNPDALALNPDLAAITRDGFAAVEEWLEFVCPSRVDYRQEIVEKARQLVRDFAPDGISIDFIRHFVYWEKVYPDRDPASLPVSCFDSLCLASFQEDEGLEIPPALITVPEKATWILESHPGEWIKWRSKLITSMVEEISIAVREEKPDIKVNIHLVPWSEKDFDGGRMRVAGQDVLSLSEHADLLSPMTYAHMVKQPPSWVHNITKDVSSHTNLPVLPSIQVGKAYLDIEYGLDEFRENLEEALLAPSAGVILWSWERLIAEPKKVELFGEIIKGN